MAEPNGGVEQIVVPKICATSSLACQVRSTSEQSIRKSNSSGLHNIVQDVSAIRIHETDLAPIPKIPIQFEHIGIIAHRRVVLDDYSRSQKAHDSGSAIVVADIAFD